MDNLEAALESARLAVSALNNKRADENTKKKVIELALKHARQWLANKPSVNALNEPWAKELQRHLYTLGLATKDTSFERTAELIQELIKSK